MMRKWKLSLCEILFNSQLIIFSFFSKYETIFVCAIAMPFARFFCHVKNNFILCTQKKCPIFTQLKRKEWLFLRPAK